MRVGLCHGKHGRPLPRSASPLLVGSLVRKDGATLWPSWWNKVLIGLGALTPVVCLTPKQGWVWTDFARRALGRALILRRRRAAPEAGEPKTPVILRQSMIDREKKVQ